MALELCGVDASYRKVSHEASLEIVRAIGFRWVDICVFDLYHHTTPEAVLTNPSGTAELVRRTVSDADLGISDVFFIFADEFDAMTVNHPDAAERDRSRAAFMKGLEFALRLGSSRLTILPGVPFAGEAEAASRARAVEELRWRVQTAGDVGVTIAVEPHHGSIVGTVDAALEVAAAVEGLTYTLDMAHFIYDGTPQAATYPLLDYTSHFHARQAAPGRMQTSVDEGVLDFAAVIAEMRKRGYCGKIAIEYVYEPYMDCNRNDCVSESATLKAILEEAVAATAVSA